MMHMPKTFVLLSTLMLKDYGDLS
uniref:Uncharacterized protein n=1 Tax=Rhizophora mucronata TaxID=61149 RepID=A0A2P2ISY9_RHIMU